MNEISSIFLVVYLIWAMKLTFGDISMNLQKYLKSHDGSRLFDRTPKLYYLSFLQENRITAWKFCYLLHKVLREGHPLCCQHSMRHRTMLSELGKLWVNWIKRKTYRFVHLFSIIFVDWEILRFLRSRAIWMMDTVCAFVSTQSCWSTKSSSMTGIHEFHLIWRWNVGSWTRSVAAILISSESTSKNRQNSSVLRLIEWFYFSA